MTRNETIAFLRCVLPPEGYYCAVIFNTAHPKPGIDKPRQVFVDTIEELADVLLHEDQQGRTVYHACASLKTKRRRTQANAMAANALWLDVDCGPDKGYPDKQGAAEGVLDFSDVLGLPRPAFVDSGFGIHCYWPLEQPVAPDEWRRLAEGLKAACVAHGLKTDPSRTADIASILRTPGTHNRKEGEHLVRFDPSTIRRFPVRSFDALRDTGPQNNRRLGRLPERSVGSIIGRIEASAGYGAVYADTIADRCGQLAALRQTGNLSEPQWYAALGVLARCEDGEIKAHEWSERDYPAYSHDETAHKLARARGLTGATTCERFHDLDPAVCDRCPLYGKINSPISVPIELVRSARTALDAGSAPLPGPYRERDGKLYLVQEDKKTGKVDELLISNMVRLKAVQTSELDATSYSYRLEKYLPRAGWSDVLLDARTMFSSSGISELAGKGVVIHDPKTFFDYMRHIVDDFNERENTQVRYDQFGWKNDNKSFLYGKMLYTSVGPVEAIGAKEVTTRGQWVGPRKGGDVDAWTDAADSLFAADMEAYSAVVLASFAAPLMRFQSQDEGGAIIHLFTPGSGMGKTTALTGAWTVWGTKEGLSLTNEDTRVSKPIAIGTLANLPVIYDELRDKDPEYIRRMVVMFTEGRDRMRGTVDGTIRHTKANWQTILLSAANNSLVDQLQGDGVDAPAFRVLELSSKLPPNIDKTKGDRLKRILSNNAGHAGDAYLRYLMNPAVLAWTQEALVKWTQDIWDATRLDSAHRFRVRAIGAIAVAAKLVNQLGLLHFQTDRIVEWLVNDIGAVKNRGTVSVISGAPAEQSIGALGEFINEHYGETLVVADKYKPRAPRMVPLLKPHNRLSVRYEIATQRLFVSASIFRDWAVKRQKSPRMVLDQLEQNQMVIRRKCFITLSAGTDIPGAQVECVEINAQHPSMSGLVASVTELQHRSSPEDASQSR